MVEFHRLLLEHRIDVGVVAIDIGTPLDHERLETCRRIAERPATGLDDVLQFLVSELLIEGDPLQWTELSPYADRAQVVVRRLSEVRIRTIAIVVAGIEAVRIPGFRKKLLRLLRVIHGLGRLPKKFEI